MPIENIKPYKSKQSVLEVPYRRRQSSTRSQTVSFTESQTNSRSPRPDRAGPDTHGTPASAESLVSRRFRDTRQNSHHWVSPSPHPWPLKQHQTLTALSQGPGWTGQLQPPTLAPETAPNTGRPPALSRGSTGREMVSEGRLRAVSHLERPPRPSHRAMTIHHTPRRIARTPLQQHFTHTVLNDVYVTI